MSIEEFMLSAMHEYAHTRAPVSSQRESKPRKYPMRESIIEIIIDEINAFKETGQDTASEKLVMALHAIKSLIPPNKFAPAEKQAAPNDAVEFAEWILDNDILKAEDGKQEWMMYETDFFFPKSTAELYQIFLRSKMEGK